MESTASSTLLYDAGRQLRKVRGIMWLSLACALGGLYWGFDLARHYGLAPGDGGVLAPLGVRLAWGAGVALLGLAFAAGMDLYGRHYIARAWLDEAGGRLRIETLRWWGRAALTVPVSEVLGSRYMRGKMSGAVEVDAPWFNVRIKGQPWVLILDAQGSFPDFALARGVFGL